VRVTERCCCGASIDVVTDASMSSITARERERQVARDELAVFRKRHRNCGPVQPAAEEAGKPPRSAEESVR
jgi:hypothetical protein